MSFGDFAGMLTTGTLVLAFWLRFGPRLDPKTPLLAIFKTAVLTRLGLIPSLLLLVVVMLVTSNWPTTFEYGLLRGLIYTPYALLEYYLTDLRLNGRKLWGIFF